MLGFVVFTLAGWSGCRVLPDPLDVGIPRTGLQLYFPFDEAGGDVARDRSQRGIVADVMGGVAWIPGIRGHAVAFDGGAGSYVGHQDAASAFVGWTSLTLSVWVKSNQVGTDAGFFICATPTGRDHALSLRYDAEGGRSGFRNGLKGGVTIEGGESVAFESQAGLQTTEWQHLVLTWESGEGFRLYRDADLVTLEFNEKREGQISGMDRMLIGKGAKDAESSWDGIVDELLLYDRALSGEEVRQLHEAQRPD